MQNMNEYVKKCSLVISIREIKTEATLTMMTTIQRLAPYLEFLFTGWGHRRVV